MPPDRAVLNHCPGEGVCVGVLWWGVVVRRSTVGRGGFVSTWIQACLFEGLGTRHLLVHARSLGVAGLAPELYLLDRDLLAPWLLWLSMDHLRRLQAGFLIRQPKPGLLIE